VTIYRWAAWVALRRHSFTEKYMPWIVNKYKHDGPEHYWNAFFYSKLTEDDLEYVLKLRKDSIKEYEKNLKLNKETKDKYYKLEAKRHNKIYKAACFILGNDRFIPELGDTHNVGASKELAPFIDDIYRIVDDRWYDPTVREKSFRCLSSIWKNPTVWIVLSPS